VSNLEHDSVFGGYWIDPACGVRSYFGDFVFNKAVQFTPPDKKSDCNDWLLLLVMKPERS
jgi:hypothetical protein